MQFPVIQSSNKQDNDPHENPLQQQNAYEAVTELLRVLHDAR